MLIGLLKIMDLPTTTCDREGTNSQEGAIDGSFYTFLHKRCAPKRRRFVYPPETTQIYLELKLRRNEKLAEHPERRLSWSPVALFRFSALTFNAHVIHYNETATRETEGHPNVVVHGPLNLINILDYWRDMYSGDKQLREISYRAMSPLYAGDEYLIRTDYSRDFDDEQTWDIVVEKEGVTCMKAEIVAA